MILLDTNVVSEAIRVDAASAVLAWIDAQAAETLYISSITVAEMTFGAGALPTGRRRAELTSSLEAALTLFEARILPFDVQAARRYGELAARARAVGKGFPIPDGYIVIAAARGFAVVARDASAFAAAGLHVIDPWAAS